MTNWEIELVQQSSLVGVFSRSISVGYSVPAATLLGVDSGWSRHRAMKPLG